MSRAQAHTVEAFVASLLLVGGLVFAMQATAVTPLSASTSNQHIENQQRAMANDLLATAAVSGDLRDAVVYWNPDEEQFANASETYYVRGGPPNPFGASLNRTFRERALAFNVYVTYHELDGSIAAAPKWMVYMGVPSDNAASASQTVALFDTTRLTAPNSNEPLADVSDDFYAPDMDDTELYNLVEVRLVVWRM